MSLLTEHLGEWRGSNRFRLMPTDAPHEAGITARVSPAVRGLLTELAYTWSHPETGEQAGLLVLGAGEEPSAVVAMWCDTFHQAPSATWLTGSSQDGVLTLSYTYAGDWAWQFVLDTSEAGRLRMRMDNVVPASAAAQGAEPGTYWAMLAELSRGG